MAPSIVLVPYLQGWSGSSVTIRLLCLPRVSPVDPLGPSSPSFALAHFKFSVHVQSDINELPQPGGSGILDVDSPVVSKALSIFNALAQQFPIDPNPPTSVGKPKNSRVKKYLPQTYRDAVNYAPGQSSALVYTDDTYSCMMKQRTWTEYHPLPPPPSKYAWGRVIAMLLRNPALAEAAGLIRPFDIHIEDLAIVKNGGFMYLTLSSDSDAAELLSGDGIKAYAARFPPLTAARDLFTPVFFPVVSPAPQSDDYADIFVEVEDYDDGWAKAVHCYQVQQLDTLSESPDGTRPSQDLGVRIGWDDEQVTVWLNRQLDETQDFDSPLGVQGYRIDARLKGTTKWHSLVHASGPVIFDGIDPIQFDGELNVEVHPVQQFAKKEGDFWLPTYFTAWTGPPMVTRDDKVVQIAGGGPDLSNRQRVRATELDIDLRYGANYQFRVRLADHTGGGPSSSGSPAVPGPSPVADINFRRWIRPMSPVLLSPTREALGQAPDLVNPPAFLEVARPLLSYPAVIFTGHYPDAFEKLLQDVPIAKAERRMSGLVDPDVAGVAITVEVAGLFQDPTATDGGYVPLFTVHRQFPSDLEAKLHIDIEWRDIPQITDLEAQEPLTGSLILPRARPIRLRIACECRPVTEYFGADDVRFSPNIQVELGNFSKDETSLFVPSLPGKVIQAFYLQPDEAIEASLVTAQQAAGNPKQAPSDIATRAAAAFDLPNDGLTFFSPPGRRTVFGCAGALNHVLGPNLANLTLTSSHDLALHWIVIIRLTLNRDWTWDGLAPDGILIQRDGTEVGRLSPNRNVDGKVFDNPDRLGTDIVFLDTIDPKTPAGSFPQELNPKYKVICSFEGSNVTSDPPLEFSIRLPVTTSPRQVPKLLSVGVAMTPYTHAPNYASANPRTRSLWLEFDSPPLDPHDSYFARLLYSAPDPVLSSPDIPTAAQLEPPLPLPLEPVRKIVPGEATDEAGLPAMQRLIPSDDSPRHFLLPLPPGTTPASATLFGFHTYEFRLGHFPGVWSTAQARFGPALRVAGVQHPPPPLVVTASRSKTAITVSAPYASPVLPSRGNVSALPASGPRSTLWALLYAQAARLDGSGEWSNVLVARTAMVAQPPRDKMAPLLVGKVYGTGVFDVATCTKAMLEMGFRPDAGLSVLAVEMMPQDVDTGATCSPLGRDLGALRVLRTSGLAEVPVIC